MKKIAEIFTTSRYAITWTICYILAMKFILISLFNFDMFSAAAWVKLSHSHLHGFGGMVFGILILSALPMYIATTSVIVRTKKPLIQIPVPKFIVRAFAPPAPPAPPQEETAQPAPEPAQETFPAEMPTELHAAFARARRNGSIRQAISAFDSARISAAVPQLQPSMADSSTDISDFPLPADFDAPDASYEDDITLPTFTDISFDSAPAPTPDDAPKVEQNTDTLMSLLGDGARQDGEFVIYKENIIAVHSDPDFWIADDTDWFASGKQRPSPITAVAARAAELNLRPVLYLAETNILDLDARIEQWQGDGIIVIINPKDLK